MGRQNRELLENIERYEEKKRVHACTTPEGVKVYAVWYK